MVAVIIVTATAKGTLTNIREQYKTVGVVEPLTLAVTSLTS